MKILATAVKATPLSVPSSVAVDRERERFFPCFSLDILAKEVLILGRGSACIMLDRTVHKKLVNLFFFPFFDDEGGNFR